MLFIISGTGGLIFVCLRFWFLDLTWQCSVFFVLLWFWVIPGSALLAVLRRPVWDVGDQTHVDHVQDKHLPDCSDLVVLSFVLKYFSGLGGYVALRCDPGPLGCKTCAPTYYALFPLTIFIYLLLGLDHMHWCSGIVTRSVLRSNPSRCSKNNMPYWGSKWGQSHISQTH